MPVNPSKIKQQTILPYLLLLTGFFILLEISFFILCNKAYLSDFTFVSGQISIPPSILPSIFYFLAIQLAIHLTFCLLTWFCALYAGYLLKFTAHNVFLLALVIWFTGIAAIMAANQYYYPNSRFTEITSIFLFSTTTARLATIALASACFMIALLSIAGFTLWTAKKSYNYTILFILFLMTGSYYAWPHSGTRHHATGNADRPNVIIIGIDSLRPDFLGYFGADQPTPFIDSFLSQSTVFPEAVTNIARTFPSWVAILTGQHPRVTGVRYNLAKTSDIDAAQTLPAIFKQQGYESIYATDETRFSNIDQHMGFDKAIVPPIGLNDFLLGTFNDFPLSNLLINTRAGKWLFPFSYANRPAFATYEPDTFLEHVREELQPQTKPLFLAVHFCLPHYPYLWASLPASQYSVQERYRASIQRVDQQIQSFFALLESEGLLNKAIVILLSDHGEALELPGDRITQRGSYLGVLTKAGEPPRFYPPSLDDEAINQSAGHGTDVLGLPQYHTLLAFKLYGMQPQHHGEITGIVPLTEIKQALLNLAGIDQHKVPLAQAIAGEIRHLPRQHIFIESDFSPEAIRTVYPETRKVLLEGIQLFQINPESTRLTVKDTMGDMIIASKQYADIYGNWMLAYYPQSHKDHMPVLINLQTGAWTNNLQSEFARRSPALAMKARLKNFYPSELKNI